MQGLSRLTARVSVAHTAGSPGEQEPSARERQKSFHILSGRLFLSAPQKSRLEKKDGKQKNKGNKGAVLSRAVWDTCALKKHTEEMQTEGRNCGEDDVSMETSVMETSAQAQWQSCIEMPRTFLQ